MIAPAITGLGLAGWFGHTPEDLEAARSRTPAPDAPLEADLAPLAEFVPKAAVRRADRLSRLMLLAACRAVADAGWSPGPMEDTATVLATGLGPTSATVEFFRTLVEQGPGLASPTAFTHSVHNIPAAMAAMLLNIPGPTATICQFETAPASALLTARTWLDEGRVARVLFGAADLAGLVAEAAASHAPDRPETSAPLRDCAAFFCLEAKGPAAYGRVAEARLGLALEGAPDKTPAMPWAGTSRLAMDMALAAYRLSKNDAPERISNGLRDRFGLGAEIVLVRDRSEEPC